MHDCGLEAQGSADGSRLAVRHKGVNGSRLGVGRFGGALLPRPF